MTRPVTIADIQRALCRRRRGVVPILPGRVGPTPPGYGLTVSTSAEPLGSSGALLAPREKCDERETSRSRIDLGEATVAALRAAMVDALYRAPPLVVQSSPQEDPGAQGRVTTWTPPGGVVIVHGGSAGSIAAADALRLGVAGSAGAGSPGPFWLRLDQPVAVGSARAPVTIFTFFAPDGRALVARRFKVRASEPSAFVVLQFTVEVAGEQVLPAFNLDSDDWFLLNVAAKPGVSVAIKAASYDSTVAYALYPEVEGWTIPVSTIDDSLQAKTFGNDRRQPL